MKGEVIENKGFLQTYDDIVCELYNTNPSSVVLANLKYNPIMYYIGMAIFGLGGVGGYSILSC